MVPCGPNCGGRSAGGPGYIGPGREPHLLFGSWGFSLLPSLSLSMWIPTAPDLTWLCVGDLGCWLPHSGTQFPPDIFQFLPCLCPAQLLAGPYFSSLHKAAGGNHGFRLLIWSLPLSFLGGWDIAPCWEQATHGAALEMLHPRPPALDVPTATSGMLSWRLSEGRTGHVGLQGLEGAHKPFVSGLRYPLTPWSYTLSTGSLGGGHQGWWAALALWEMNLASLQHSLVCHPRGPGLRHKITVGLHSELCPSVASRPAPLQALHRCDGQVPGSLL